MMKRTYFEKLRDHPGLEVAGFVTMLAAFAGATNETASWYVGMFFGAVVVGGFVFGLVLISNFTRK